MILSADLTDRAATLAVELGLFPGPLPRFQVCWDRLDKGVEGRANSDGVIKVAWQLRAAPDYVLDLVLIHELVHVAGHWEHDAEFDALVGRYGKSALAEAWLSARGEAIWEGRAYPE